MILVKVHIIFRDKEKLKDLSKANTFSCIGLLKIVKLVT